MARKLGTQNILAYGLGAYGSAISTGAVLKGNFIALQALADTTFTALSGEMSGISAFDSSGVTLPKGMSIFGQFTHVDVNSGTIVAYYA